MFDVARVLLLWAACAVAALPTCAAEPADAGAPLDAPYDGNHWAVLVRAGIQARYLPVGLSDARAIRRAVADGTLREAVYPSLQLADDVAYITTNALSSSTLDRRKNILGLCRQPGGFRLLLQDTATCTDGGAPGLRFEQTAAGGLVCATCAALGWPTRWERHDRPAQCPLPAWDLAAAQRQFGAWRQRFEQDMQPYLHGATEQRWEAQAAAGRSAQATVVPASRASAALIGMSTSPDAFVDASGLPGELRRSDLLARLLQVLGTAQVIGRGGRYPEPLPALEATCAQVWYLALPGVAAHASAPPADRFVRDSVPFITVQQHGDQLRLAGLSRELLAVVLAPERPPPACCTGDTRR
ncbi:MAG TPA: hypothetical protein DCM50_05395 [Stenotrophomonas sp.]|nr:hypothetical protein [Stenotrophomonas sp.]